MRVRSDCYAEGPSLEEVIARFFCAWGCLSAHSESKSIQATIDFPGASLIRQRGKNLETSVSSKSDLDKTLSTYFVTQALLKSCHF
jgi:hypothetical protein